MKKILCLCDAGQVRSVAMASVLRSRGHFAVAGSWDNWCKVPSGDRIISEWDEVIQMQERGKHFIGRDEFGDCLNMELIHKCKLLAIKLGY